MLFMPQEVDEVGPDTDTSNIFDKTMATHQPAPGTDPMQKYGGDVLPYVEAVNQTVGGIPTTADQLGWSDGVLSTRQKWEPLSGVMLMPPKTAELRIGSPYGMVGLNNRAQNLLLGTDFQEVSDLLPSGADIARSYTRPMRFSNA